MISHSSSVISPRITVQPHKPRGRVRITPIRVGESALARTTQATAREGRLDSFRNPSPCGPILFVLDASPIRRRRRPAAVSRGFVHSP
jgi:hypothetical protein